MSTTKDNTTALTFTDGLRALADLLDTHPSALQPYDDYRHLICVGSREEMAAIIRDLGGRWEKDSSDDYLGLTREIGGGVRIHVYAAHKNVCERVVVGTETVEVPDPDLVAEVPTKTVEREIVEWRCPPSLLAEPPVTREEDEAWAER